MEPAEAHATGGLTVRGNLWVEMDGRVVLSRWRVGLLEAIEATGSIRAAASQLEITYDLAWHRVDEMESALGASLVDRQRGGAKGGSANLTALGRALVARFNGFAVQTDKVVEQVFNESFGDWNWRAFADLREPE